MKNNAYLEMKKARSALVSAGMSLFNDKLTYGENTAPFEERIIALIKEYDKIIDDYANSDCALIKEER
jgi:hypothetical protein